MNEILNVHVEVQVKPGMEEAFVAASGENARCSRMEPGVIRFDLLRDAELPGRFLLIEVYRNPAAAIAHKETAHYAQWRDVVAEMMAEPRTSVKYVNLFPDDAGWPYPSSA